MAGEIVSNGMSNNAIAHSVNRAAAFLANRPVHRCEFRLSIPVPAFSFNSQSLDFNGSQWNSLPVWFTVAFGSILWVTTDYIPQDAWPESFTTGTGGITAWPSVYDDSVTHNRWVTFLSLYPHIGASPFKWVLTADVIMNPGKDTKYPNYDEICNAHSAWTAPWREAFRNTSATGTTGTLVFTPMSLSDTAAFYSSEIPPAIVQEGWGIPAADRDKHIYVPGGEFTAQVAIAEQ